MNLEHYSFIADSGGDSVTIDQGRDGDGNRYVVTLHRDQLLSLAEAMAIVEPSTAAEDQLRRENAMLLRRIRWLASHAISFSQDFFNELLDCHSGLEMMARLDSIVEWAAETIADLDAATDQSKPSPKDTDKTSPKPTDEGQAASTKAPPAFELHPSN